jgi:CRISPR-associated helicase Cas3/CRISPR-associated endonuclease Cas3-HD
VTGNDLARLAAKSSAVGRPAESLTHHSAATLAAAQQLQHRVGNVPDAVLGGRFWAAAQLAGLTHDGGKLADGFQEMVAGRRRSWGQRHEVLSLGFLPSLIPDHELRLWVAGTVVTHHRPLSHADGRGITALYGQCRPDELRSEFGPLPAASVPMLEAWFRTAARQAGLPVGEHTDRPLTCEELLADTHRLLRDVLDHWQDRVPADDGLTAVLLQGAVTLADHLSSAHRDLSSVQPLDGDFRLRLETWFHRQGQELHPHQRKAAAVDGHLLLRSPTGSGKTEAVLLWASRQVTLLTAATGGVPRVFYTLPYLASINAMAVRFKTTLSAPDAVGVAHSRAASYHLAAAIAPEDDEASPSCRVEAATKAISRAAATRLFYESVRVATPYQLMRAALAGPAHSSVLIDAVNSVFVLDELHAYDPRRLGYLLASARLWERLGGRIAVVSATLPDALAELFTTTLNSPPALVTADGLGLPLRHQLRIRDHHLTAPTAIAEIRDRLHRNESVLVVANNVADAIHLYTELAPTVRQLHGDQAAILLHSRFRRCDRSRIETKIRERFGADREANKRTPGLLVATQCVEVSLDLDLDVLFSAAAPMEALLQRFGRVNRLALRAPADVIIHRPQWTTRRSEDFADGIYPRPPVELAWQILHRHDNQAVDETDATGWLNTIYSSPWGDQWRDDVASAQKIFSRHFLDFRSPFDDRAELTEAFDELFNGTEAILTDDHDAYTQALAQVPSNQQAARLLADEYLIPMPHYAGRLPDWDHKLKIRVIEGEYDPELGLLAIHGRCHATYRAGEVL